MRIDMTEHRPTHASGGAPSRPPLPNVRPIGPDECHEAVEVLVRSFFDFSMNRYLFPDAKKRAWKLRFLYLRMVTMYRGVGGAFITGDGSGVALWAPPQYWRGVGAWRCVRAGLLLVPFYFCWELPLRRINAVRDIERRHHSEIRGPHWSLELIGVDPERQRTGSGGALIRHVLDQADQQELPSYVITHDDRNVAYYERFGFHLIGDAPFEAGAPPTCSLLRPVSAKT